MRAAAAALRARPLPGDRPRALHRTPPRAALGAGLLDAAIRGRVPAAPASVRPNAGRAAPAGDVRGLSTSAVGARLLRSIVSALEAATKHVGGTAGHARGFARGLGASAGEAAAQPGNVLSAEQNRLVARTKAVVDRLRLQLEHIDAEADDVEVLQHVSDGLRDLFLLVVVGEFNTGKSTFLNALLGGKFLKEGVTPTTNSLQVVRYGALDPQGRVRVELASNGKEGDEVENVFLPVEWLRQISVVDTPGTNAVIARHQRLTEHFVPRSDLVLFVTSVERPFTESERAFLQRIREWGKKVIVVVNKVDILEDEIELEQVLSFVRDHAKELLGTSGSDPARIFPISGRQALKAKVLSSQAQTAGGWPSADARAEFERRSKASRFGSLEAFILESLTARERFRLKLENPIGCALRLIEKYVAALERRKAALDADRATLAEIEQAVEEHVEDMRRDFRYHLSHVENVLAGLTERAAAFYDAHLQLANLLQLLRGDPLRRAFEREVLGDTPQRIERHVAELAHWIADKNARQWHFVEESVERRAGAKLAAARTAAGATRPGRRPPPPAEERERHRAAVVEAAVGRAAVVLRGLDGAAEGQRLVEGTREALLRAAGVGIAAGLASGAAVAVASSALLDAAGLLAGAALAGGSLLVLPRRRAWLKADARKRTGELRQRLEAALREQLEDELASASRRIEEQVRPYAAAVAKEEERVAGLAGRLAEERVALRALLDDVAREAAEPGPR